MLVLSGTEFLMRWPVCCLDPVNGSVQRAIQSVLSFNQHLFFFGRAIFSYLMNNFLVARAEKYALLMSIVAKLSALIAS